MRFRPHELFPCILALAIALFAFSDASYGQPTVVLSPSPSPSPTPFPDTMTAPTGSFTFEAAVTGFVSPVTIDRVVFYRNDVPFETDPSYPYRLSQSSLNPDNYTYRARAYLSNGLWGDSNEIKLTVNPQPKGVRIPVEYRGNDRAQEIRDAITYLTTGGNTGGTIYFPCTVESGHSAIYVIKSTVEIPSNITLQGESSAGGHCQIWWANGNTADGPCVSGATPVNTSFTPMFKVLGNASGVRFKDLHLRSMTDGLQCYRTDYEDIQYEKTAAVELRGNATDVIFENVAVWHFTHGIRAISTGEPGISNIRLRGVTPSLNHRQLYIDAEYAWNWDVQNLNMGGMWTMQGGVEIEKAGRPAPYVDNTSLKFLQLNCNGNPSDAGFCMSVKTHGGIYIRGMHHEGIETGLKVLDVSPAENADPIVIEAGAATGVFEDASMQLYLIGAHVWAAPEVAPVNIDNARLRFTGEGVQADVFDCGDIHWDMTDTQHPLDPQGSTVTWMDLRMGWTHSERYRGSMFADNNGYTYVKEHTPCPSNIKDFGGEHFDNGVLPTESFYEVSSAPYLAYTYVITEEDCPEEGPCDITQLLKDYMFDPEDETVPYTPIPGAVYLDGDEFEVSDTIVVPAGKQIVGAPGAVVTLTEPDIPLFKLIVPVDSNDGRLSGVTIRNLDLITAEDDTVGIQLVGTESGTAGTSSDMHFSGLQIEGFEKGVTAGPYVHPVPTPSPAPTPPGHPMMDGVTWKNMTFVNNQKAVEVTSANTSNWNVMDLNISSNKDEAVGWYQRASGNSIQDVTCAGTGGETMLHCVELEFSLSYIIGLKTNVNVTNGLTIGLSPHAGSSPYIGRQGSIIVLRNNDFTESALNIAGRAFITSMNNFYENVYVSAADEWDHSRATFCGDNYGTGPGFTNLEDLVLDRYVGVAVQTRTECGARPYPWDEAIRFAEDDPDDEIVGIPFVGKFLGGDAVEEFVVYKPGSPGYFHIQEQGGPADNKVAWGGTAHQDTPLVADILDNNRTQVVVFRRSTTPVDWWFLDPTSSVSGTVPWGLSTDRPFTGNFITETTGGSITGNKDEVAVYRPSTGVLYIMNPRTGDWTYISTGITDSGNDIVVQVGDFLGVANGFKQIALYDRSSGDWTLFNPQASTPSTPVGTDSLASYHADDVPVSARYFSDDCDQIAVWRPSTQKFIVEDPSFGTCGSRSSELLWGSNNFGSGTTADDDIPLTIGSGGIRRPTTYRPDHGLFEYAIAKGTWWVHDPVPEP